MPSREDTSAHRAGVVVKLHLHEGRAHPRYLAAALLRACGEAGHAPRQPSQEAEASEAERDGDVEPPAHPEQSGGGERTEPDRKSTRLNSSHLGISYAVFCLKKQ